MMLVTYRGQNSAINFKAGGMAIRIAKDQDILVNADVVADINKGHYTSKMVKAKTLVIDDLKKGYDKSELLDLAQRFNIDVDPSDTVAVIRAALSGKTSSKADKDNSGDDEQPNFEDMSDDALSDLIMANGSDHEDDATREDLLKIAGELDLSK